MLNLLTISVSLCATIGKYNDDLLTKLLSYVENPKIQALLGFEEI